MPVQFRTLPNAFRLNQPANVLNILRAFFGVAASTTPVVHSIPEMRVGGATPIHMAEAPTSLVGLLDISEELRAIDGELAKSSDQSRRALAAVEALQLWLNLSQDRVAELVGVSKSAIMYWRREGAAPRSASLRRLYKIHALVRALKEAFPELTPLDTLEAAQDAEKHSAYWLLSSGRYDDAENLLRDRIFKRSQQPLQTRSQIASRDDDDLFPPPSPLNLRPRKRVTKSRRPSGVDRSRE